MSGNESSQNVQQQVRMQVQQTPQVPVVQQVQQAQAQQQQQTPINIITALSTAFKTQTGENIQNDRIAALLLQHMPQIDELEKQGKLNNQQILQLRAFAQNNTKNGSVPVQPAQQPVSQAAGPSRPSQPTIAPAPSSTSVNLVAPSAFRGTAPLPTLQSTTTGDYPISQTLNIANPGPQPFPSATGRPTLSGGFASGRMSGTPAQIARTDDTSLLGSTDTARRKNTPNDQSMRRSIQDLVFSIDPNVKIESEVEDLLVEIADEFIDSVTNFGCRLAKHRGGDTLEVRDLQLHLERNHNIRIPGFASDETRISISQSAIAPTTGGGGSSSKKGVQNSQITLRSQRLTQVAQAKKEAKLV